MKSKGKLKITYLHVHLLFWPQAFWRNFYLLFFLSKYKHKLIFMRKINDFMFFFLYVCRQTKEAITLVQLRKNLRLLKVLCCWKTKAEINKILNFYLIKSISFFFCLISNMNAIFLHYLLRTYVQCNTCNYLLITWMN